MPNLNNRVAREIEPPYMCAIRIIEECLGWHEPVHIRCQFEYDNMVRVSSMFMSWEGGRLSISLAEHFAGIRMGILLGGGHIECVTPYGTTTRETWVRIDKWESFLYENLMRYRETWRYWVLYHRRTKLIQK